MTCQEEFDAWFAGLSQARGMPSPGIAAWVAYWCALIDEGPIATKPAWPTAGRDLADAERLWSRFWTRNGTSVEMPTTAEREALALERIAVALEAMVPPRFEISTEKVDALLGGLRMRRPAD